MSESLSVSHEYDQQRRTFREAVCEKRAGAADGDRAKRRARGVILSTRQLRKSKGGDVKRAVASARTSEHDRPIFGLPDRMAPALGVVGGTPGWAVREIISIYFRAGGAILLEYYAFYSFEKS